MQPTEPSLKLSFSETMTGFLSKGFAPADDHWGAALAGREANTRAEFTLTIVIDELARFFSRGELVSQARGTVRADGFTGPDGSDVGGVFKLFTEGGGSRAVRMRYLLPFQGLDGKSYLLDGTKEISPRVKLGVFGAATTLYTMIREGQEPSGPVVASGIISIHFKQILRQASSFKVLGARGRREKTGVLARFLWTFVASLWQATRPRWRPA
jgi:cholesterol oxidase